MPVLVVLKEDLKTLAFDDVQNTVVVRVALIKIRGSPLSHFRIDFVQFAKELVGPLVDGLGI